MFAVQASMLVMQDCMHAGGGGRSLAEVDRRLVWVVSGIVGEATAMAGGG